MVDNKRADTSYIDTRLSREQERRQQMESELLEVQSRPSLGPDALATAKKRVAETQKERDELLKNLNELTQGKRKQELLHRELVAAREKVSLAISEIELRRQEMRKEVRKSVRQSGGRHQDVEIALENLRTTPEYQSDWAEQKIQRGRLSIDTGRVARDVSSIAIQQAEKRRSLQQIDESLLPDIQSVRSQERDQQKAARLQRDISISEQKQQFLAAEKQRRIERVERFAQTSGEADLRRVNLQSMTSAALRGHERPEYEAFKAQQGLARMGGTREERREVADLTKEMVGLVSIVREAKEALGKLTEGTEEYTDEQRKLETAQKVFDDRARARKKIEEDTEMRGGRGGMTPGQVRDWGAVGGALGGMLGAAGESGANRFMTEEQLRMTKLGVSASGFQDMRNASRDAVSLLAAAGKELGLTKSNVADIHLNETIRRKMNPEGRISVQEQRALDRLQMRKVGWAAQAVGAVADIGLNTAGDISTNVGGAGIGGVMTAGAAPVGGALLKNAPRALALPGLNPLTQSLTGNVAQPLAATMDLSTRGLDRIPGVGKLLSGPQTAIGAIPSVLSESAKNIQAEMELSKVTDVTMGAQQQRERHGMFTGPMLQTLLNQIPGIRGLQRAGFATRGERVGLEESFFQTIQGPEAAAIGAMPEDVAESMTGARRAMGRRGGASQVGMMALRAENAGLMNRGQTFQALSAFRNAGAGGDSPVELARLIGIATSKGLSDSREMQQLVEASTITSRNTGAIGGSMSLLSRMVTRDGGDRQVIGAQKALEALNQMSSGRGGGPEDIAKLRGVRRVLAGQGANLEKTFGEGAGRRLTEQMQFLTVDQIAQMAEGGEAGTTMMGNLGYTDKKQQQSFQKMMKQLLPATLTSAFETARIGSSKEFTETMGAFSTEEGGQAMRKRLSTDKSLQGRFAQEFAGGMMMTKGMQDPAQIAALFRSLTGIDLGREQFEKIGKGALGEGAVDKSVAGFAQALDSSRTLGDVKTILSHIEKDGLKVAFATIRGKEEELKVAGMEATTVDAQAADRGTNLEKTKFAIDELNKSIISLSNAISEWVKKQDNAQGGVASAFADVLVNAVNGLAKSTSPSTGKTAPPPFLGAGGAFGVP